MVKHEEKALSMNEIIMRRKNPVKVTFEDVHFEVTMKLSKEEAKEKGLSNRTVK